MGTSAAIGYQKNDKLHLIFVEGEGYPDGMTQNINMLINVFGKTRFKQMILKSGGIKHLSQLAVMLPLIMYERDSKAKMYSESFWESVEELKYGIGPPLKYIAGYADSVKDAFSNGAAYVYIIGEKGIRYNKVWRGSIDSSASIKRGDVDKKALIERLFELG